VHPRVASEAKRVLRKGGLLVACTTSRANDPELVPDGYSRTTFDAEEAEEIVAGVFGAANIEVERSDTLWCSGVAGLRWSLTQGATYCR
jgi:23S rRNA G2069 N7-methylase RlmK/C1962 C5-methylase RlmI